MQKGTLTVIAGPMFSGKTGKLVALVNTFAALKIPTVVIKPEMDARYGNKNEIHSHDHQTVAARLVTNEAVPQFVVQLLQEKPQKVIIDEVQFFDKAIILAAIKKLQEAGIGVVAAGLLYDFRKQPFGATLDLWQAADSKLELFAICQRCGGFANHTERTAGGNTQIEVGQSESYIAVCSTCHRVYGDRPNV